MAKAAKQKIDWPEVRLKPSDNQPSKMELEETLHLDATPEDVIRAAFRQVKIVKDD